MSRVEQQESEQGGGVATWFDPKAGALFGAGAWIAGFVLTAVFAVVGFNRDVVGGSGPVGGNLDEVAGSTSEAPSMLDAAGWFFYNVHFVDVGAAILGQGFWINFITGNVRLTGVVAAEASGSEITRVESELAAMWHIPTPVWLLIPVVTLVAAGFLVANRSGARDATEAAKAGASVIVGYGILAFVGTFLFTWSPGEAGLEGLISIGPHTLHGIVLMGVVYPVALGSLGGAVAARTGSQPVTGAEADRPPGNQQDGSQQPRQGEQPSPGQQAPQDRHAPQGEQPARGQQQGSQQPTQGQQQD